jgi:hypothetical protein
MGVSRYSRYWTTQRNGLTPCEAYQKLLEEEDADYLVYLHDDVTVHDPDWGKAAVSHFQRIPTV